MIGPYALNPVQPMIIDNRIITALIEHLIKSGYRLARTYKALFDKGAAMIYIFCDDNECSTLATPNIGPYALNVAIVLLTGLARARILRGRDGKVLVATGVLPVIGERYTLISMDHNVGKEALLIIHLRHINLATHT